VIRLIREGFIDTEYIQNEIERGDQFTFLFVDRNSKLIINSLVGKRTRENAAHFLTELKHRMAPRSFQLTTDNWHIYSGYTGSVRAVFGQQVNYATETKIFAKPEQFLPRRLVSLKRKRQIGEPDTTAATTCHAERQHKPVCENFHPPVHSLPHWLFKEAG
jgi:IS1 family transposase